MKVDHRRHAPLRVATVPHNYSRVQYPLELEAFQRLRRIGRSTQVLLHASPTRLMLRPSTTTIPETTPAIESNRDAGVTTADGGQCGRPEGLVGEGPPAPGRLRAHHTHRRAVLQASRSMVAVQARVASQERAHALRPKPTSYEVLSQRPGRRGA